MAETIGGAKKAVTVIIRCYNEMPYTAATVERLFQQRFTDFDVIAVDSGSTDGSAEVFKEWKEKMKGKCDIRLFQISKEEYFPGRTLNMAMGHAQGQFAVLLNADATPVDEYWLERLIKPLQEDKLVVAAFSRQVPRKETSPLLRHDIERFYPPFKPHFNWKYTVHFSHVGTAVRRITWMKRPYYTAAYASEDKEWAKHWLDAGYKIEYVPEAVITHSHNYNLAQYRHRMYIEAVADMFIYPDMKPSCLRQVKSMVGAILRDWKRCLKDGKALAALRAPFLRFAQCLGTYMGQKAGKRLRPQPADRD